VIQSGATHLGNGPENFEEIKLRRVDVRAEEAKFHTKPTPVTFRNHTAYNLDTDQENNGLITRKNLHA